MPESAVRVLPPDTSLGERLTTDLFERRFYAEDMAPVPALLVRPFFRTLPDAVALPRTTAEVAEAMRGAFEAGMPVVPRGAASTALFNAVPLRGGLVLDLNALAGVVAVDEARRRATVRAGTRWLDLERALAPHGLAVKSYPSSAVAATVGGWLSTQGRGLGSLAHGPLLEQVVRAEVVLPDGRVAQLTAASEPPLAWFAGAEGTLGVLTEIELAVRPLPPKNALHLRAFADPAGLQAGLLTLARAEPRPFALSFSDGAYARLLEAGGFPPPPPGLLLLASYQGEAGQVARGQRQLAALSGDELESELALEEWHARLYHLRAKRGGPSLLAAELWLPVETLAGYLHAVEALSGRARTPIGTYGQAVSPEQLLVMSVYPCDARRTLDYTLALGLTGQLYRLGGRFGGRPYGVGLWNTPYLSQIFSRPELQTLRARKRALDPAGRLNPGKLYRAPFPLWPPLFKPATAVLAAAHRARGGRTKGG